TDGKTRSLIQDYCLRMADWVLRIDCGNPLFKSAIRNPQSIVRSPQIDELPVQRKNPSMATRDYSYQ
ncbi:MAG: hypothetical protein L0220_29435, partial [Acidobacteria bacterium]|nr:hypothetical protein [Acidobacteriota bacterium]